MARDKTFRTAEAKIAEARRTAATALYLRGMQLTELPESLAALTQLRTLNFSATQPIFGGSYGNVRAL